MINLKKQNELDIFYKYIDQVSSESWKNKSGMKFLRKLISNVKNGNVVNYERPDFIIKTKTEVIGIEHMFIPLFLKKDDRKDGTCKISSNSKFLKSRDKKYIESRIDKSNISKKDVDYLVNGFNDRFLRIKDFDYNDYINSFRDILYKHISSIKEYNDKSKYNKFGIFLELEGFSHIIGYSYNNRFNFLQNIPLTKDIFNVDLIKDLKLTGVNYLLIYISNPGDKNLDLSYFIDVYNFNKIVNASNLQIYDHFDLYKINSSIAGYSRSANGELELNFNINKKIVLSRL